MKELEGRTAIVTGASRGIGPQIARVVGREGMNIVLVARSAAGLEQVAAELGSAGQHAIAMPAELSDHSTLDRIVEATEEQFGTVDLIVNNAGITATRRFETSSDEETAQIIDVNLTAGILLTKRVLPAMLERGRGNVVMIASLAGKVGSPYESVYAASKAGQIAFVQSLREELHGSGVGASVVCPGFVMESGMWADAGISQGIRQPRLGRSHDAGRGRQRGGTRRAAGQRGGLRQPSADAADACAGGVVAQFPILGAAPDWAPADVPQGGGTSRGGGAIGVGEGDSPRGAVSRALARARFPVENRAGLPERRMRCRLRRSL